MHNINHYGGTQLPCQSGIKVQFQAKEQMEAWLKLMREAYPTMEQFCPFINREDNIVVY